MSGLFSGKRQNLMSVISLLAAASLLSGCASVWSFLWPPCQSQALLADYAKTNVDETSLFMKLRQSPPSCSYANTSALFQSVEKDLSDANADAEKVRNNFQTVDQIKGLQESLAMWQAEVADVSVNTPCVPVNLIEHNQNSFLDGLNGLTKLENTKPKGS